MGKREGTSDLGWAGDGWYIHRGLEGDWAAKGDEGAEEKADFRTLVVPGERPLRAMEVGEHMKWLSSSKADDERMVEWRNVALENEGDSESWLEVAKTMEGGAAKGLGRH